MTDYFHRTIAIFAARIGCVVAESQNIPHLSRHSYKVSRRIGVDITCFCSAIWDITNPKTTVQTGNKASTPLLHVALGFLALH